MEEPRGPAQPWSCLPFMGVKCWFLPMEVPGVNSIMSNPGLYLSLHRPRF